MQKRKKKKLDQLNFNEVKKVKKDIDKNVLKVFDVRNSVNLKSSYGGTFYQKYKKNDI